VSAPPKKYRTPKIGAGSIRATRVDVHASD
jgi:hypothetical protein